MLLVALDRSAGSHTTLSATSPAGCWPQIQLIIDEQTVVNTLLVTFDLGGTFVFALSKPSSAHGSDPLVYEVVRERHPAKKPDLKSNNGECVGTHCLKQALAERQSPRGNDRGMLKHDPERRPSSKSSVRRVGNSPPANVNPFAKTNHSETMSPNAQPAPQRVVASVTCAQLGALAPDCSDNGWRISFPIVIFRPKLM